TQARRASEGVSRSLAGASGLSPSLALRACIRPCCVEDTQARASLRGLASPPLQDPRLSYLDALERHLECVGVGGDQQGHGRFHVAARYELAEALVEIEHAFEEADADGVGEFLVLPLDDQIPDRRVHGHDLVGREALDARLDAGQELLAYDG